MGMKHDLLPRLGSFFILIGLILVILFIGSIMGEESNFLYLLLGGGAIYIGYRLRRTAAPPEPARFASIRKIQNTRQKRREELMSRSGNTKDRDHTLSEDQDQEDWT
jgi:hypothetical protein